MSEKSYQLDNEKYVNSEEGRDAAGIYVAPPINVSGIVGFQKLKDEFARAWPKMQDPTIQELVRELSKENDWAANWEALKSLCPNDF